MDLHKNIIRANEIDKEYYNDNLPLSNSSSLINQEQVTSPPTNVTTSTQPLRRSSHTRRPVISIDSETNRRSNTVDPPKPPRQQ